MSLLARFVLGVIAVTVAVGIGVAVIADTSVACEAASAVALDAIETGARRAFEPLELSGGQKQDSTIQFATGDQVSGVLVGASTPAGDGVWVMDEDSYSGSGSGLVYAVNDAARSTTIWGEDTNFDPVDSSEVSDVESCLE